MFAKPLRVFRVYFEPNHRPFAPAEFELVALRFPDATSARIALGKGNAVHGKRLIGWPAQNDPRVRVIDLMCPITLTKETVRSVQPCNLMCLFHTSVDDALASEGAV